MKGLLVFVLMVVSFSMLNIIQKQASATTYKEGIEALMTKNHQIKNTRTPAIVSVEE